MLIDDIILIIPLYKYAIIYLKIQQALSTECPSIKNQTIKLNHKITEGI